jgi:NitT/TauT family transport system substrate-binding protein
MTRIRTGLSLLILTAFVGALLAACGGDTDDPDPTSTPEVSTGELTPVTVGNVPVLIYAPVMVALEKGYFADQGLDVTLAPLAGGADMVTLTANGDFDIGIGGAGPAFFNAIDRGIELDIIAPLHFERPPQSTPLVVSRERFENGEITDVADLEGLRVSVNARGATEYWLDQALRTADLTIEDIDLQTLPFPDVPAALESGALDGAMLGEPLATRAVQEGLVSILAEDFISDFQPTFVWVNPQFAEENRDVVVAFLAAYLQASRDMIGETWDSEENLQILEEYTSVTPELIRESSRSYWEPNGEIRAQDLTTIQEFFAERGLLEYEEMIDPDEIIDRSYVEEALEIIGRHED